MFQKLKLTTYIVEHLLTKGIQEIMPLSQLTTRFSTTFFYNEKLMWADVDYELVKQFQVLK